METTLTIKATVREDKGKKAKKIRAKGKIPAILYGHNLENLLLAVDRREFEKVFAKSGESTLVKLEVGSDKPRTVLIHDVQHHILTDIYTHVDFYQVDMSEKLKAKVIINFIGESKAVKDLGGVLMKNLSEVEVEALPSDLPSSLTVDISKLQTFEDVISVSDLVVDPKKVKILANLSETIAKVNPPRTEEELKALEEKPVEAVAEVEGVVKKEPEAGTEVPSDDKKKEKAEEK